MKTVRWGGVIVDYAEFRRHLGKAGLTINDFAAYLGVRPASVSNHSKGGVVPRTYALLAVLLGDVADRGIPFRDIFSRYGLFQIADDGNKVQQLDMFRVGRTTPEQNDKSRRNRPVRSSTSVRRRGVSND